MASSDWSELTNGLGSGVVRRAVTAGTSKPNGGGTFVYGANSLGNTAGAWGLYTNQANFSPTPSDKGGSIRAAIRRGPSIGFAPLLFIGLQSNDVNAQGYLLGLADSDPARIALRKGALLDGIPDVAPGTLGVLRRSAQSVAADSWLHLRLDMVVNLNGDVVLNVFQSDLVANPVTAPVWTAVTGLEQFIDDALGVNSGSAPFTQGYMGFGARSAEVNRRAYWDHLEAHRQT